MKISKSKKELARIISENGGWCDGTEWAAQDKLGPDAMADEVCFYLDKPESPSGADMWNARLPSSTVFRHFHSNGLISGWHQSCLSREEYFHLYPAPDADGWIEWKGGECPVDDDDIIDVKFSDGDTLFGVYGAWDWGEDAYGCNIIAYRLHNQEQANPEFCDSVTRSIPEPEAKPTIEHLAAEYRNRKDYADRKQEEADAAKADAESKLAELVSAGKAIGLVVSVAEPEPEVVITDWRDLQVGDIVKVVGSDNCQWKRLDGLELRITSVGNSESDLVFAPSDGEDWLHGGNTQWMFIRRP